MNLRSKLLSMAIALSFSVGGYYSFIDNDVPKKTKRDQKELQQIDKKADKNDQLNIVIDNPENKQEQKTSSIKSSLVSQGSIFSEMEPQGSTFSEITTFQSPPRATKNIHSVTREEAVNAALDGSEESIRILQQYFDSSAGRPEQITQLASAVLSDLGNSALANNSHSMQEAAAKVIDAAARAATSAYAIPYTSISDFGLKFGDLGWDFGPTKKIPHHGFIRITPTSGNIDGKGILALETSKENNFLKDGIINVSAFGIPEIEKGSFRLYIFTAPLPSGIAVSHPFGERFGVNGNQLRVIDTAKTGSPQWAKLSSNGISLTGEEGNRENASYLEPIKLGIDQKNDIDGWLLTTIVQSNGEAINMKFESDNLLETYIVGIILSPVDMGEMEDLLNEQLFAMLENLAPGGKGGTPYQNFNNDYSANIISQFFSNPNTRSAPGPKPGPLKSLGSRITLPPEVPPADNPPVDNPPVDNPPVNDPPVNDPPVNDPPVNDPPVNDPPVNDPPVNDPPVNDPPVNDPPVNDPPVNDPPVNDPPVDDPPVDNPPVNNPPEASIQLFADAGPDQWVNLGMDFNLDGCAPDPFSIATISLCDIENKIGTPAFDDLFTINWQLLLEDSSKVSIGNDLHLFDVNANNNDLFPLSGTGFPGLGSYVIELSITYNGNPFNYDNITVTNNGVILTSTDEMTLYIINILAPPMLAIFGLGLAFAIYWRRKIVAKLI